MKYLTLHSQKTNTSKWLRWTQLLPCLSSALASVEFQSFRNHFPCFCNFLQLFTTFRNFSQLFTSFHNFSQLFATLACFCNFLQLFTFFDIFSQLFTYFYNFTQVFTTFHNFLQLFTAFRNSFKPLKVKGLPPSPNFGAGKKINILDTIK